MSRVQEARPCLGQLPCPKFPRYVATVWSVCPRRTAAAAAAAAAATAAATARSVEGDRTVHILCLCRRWAELRGGIDH